MKLAITLAMLLAMTSCTTASIHRVDLDPETGNQTTCEASYSAFWQDKKNIGVEACGASGGAESVQGELSEALLRAMVSGLQ